MKFDYLVLIYLISFFCGCDSKTTTLSDSSTLLPFSFEDKQKQIEKFVRDVYFWVENKSELNDFDLEKDAKNEKYIGVDFKKLKQRLKELKNTNYFDSDFLRTYKNIAFQLDNQLKNNQIQWQVGELSPIGMNANSWCNCQDLPDDYWQIIRLDSISISNNRAVFDWTVDSNFRYNMEVINIGNTWKISKMEGFQQLEKELMKLK